MAIKRKRKIVIIVAIAVALILILFYILSLFSSLENKGVIKDVDQTLKKSSGTEEISTDKERDDIIREIDSADFY